MKKIRLREAQHRSFVSARGGMMLTFAQMMLRVPRKRCCVLRTQMKNPESNSFQDFLEAPPGFEPGDKGFADPCLTAWLWRHIHARKRGKGTLSSFRISNLQEGEKRPEIRRKTGTMVVPVNGADYGARTRHLHLGKVALYQMS